MRETKTAVIGSVLSVVVVLVLGGPSVITAQILAGASGQSSEWGSGWLDLAPPVDFAKGERLKLLVGGSASKVLVRLLPKGRSPDSSVGIVDGPIDVPKTRVVEIVLPDERKQVIQISVHGGPNPWGRFPLGGGNGPATIESAERIKP